MNSMLRSNPECPVGDYPWKKYYWERSMPNISYEEEYWGIAIDPDGKKRNILDEWSDQVENFRHILSFLETYNPGNILDIGCGPGFFLSGLNSKWKNYGIDISKKAAEVCKKYAIMETGELTKANYKNNYFDVVTMIHVVEHLLNPLAYIDKIKQILKKDGLFIIETPDFDSPCARRFGKNFRMLHDPGHVSLFSTNSLIKMLEDYDFEIISIEYPYFETKYFTEENLLKMMDESIISPPFYGNHVVVYALNRKNINSK